MTVAESLVYEIVDEAFSKGAADAVLNQLMPAHVISNALNFSTQVTLCTMQRRDERIDDKILRDNFMDDEEPAPPMLESIRSHPKNDKMEETKSSAASLPSAPSPSLRKKPTKPGRRQSDARLSQEFGNRRLSRLPSKDNNAF